MYSVMYIDFYLDLIFPQFFEFDFPSIFYLDFANVTVEQMYYLIVLYCLYCFNIVSTLFKHCSTLFHSVSYCFMADADTNAVKIHSQFIHSERLRSKFNFSIPICFVV